MDKIFTILQQNYQKEPYMPISKRKKLLIALKRLLQSNAEELARSISEDFKPRSHSESLFLEVFPCVAAIKYCLKHLNAWALERKRRIPWYFLTAKAQVFPQPLGIVGVLVPWNYPLLLALTPAIYALAAGNRVMIKMSELSPSIGQLLDNLINSDPLLNEVISVINGDVGVAKHFSSLPFNHLVFTGSTRVAKAIMETVAKNLTPLTLELGGKSPVIISTTAKSQHFERIFMGKLFNAGQTCLAPDYLLIPTGWEKRIEERFTQFIACRYPNLLENPNYSAIITDKHRQNLDAMLEDARVKGGHILSFGDRAGQKGNKMPVHLVFNVNQTMLLMQKEIFGPILPILSYRTMNEAISLINSMPNPLALYYFGKDKEEEKLIKSNILSGAMAINDTVVQIAVNDLPFGGVGESGIGHYHGQEGFDNFSKLKPVFKQSYFSPITALYPPYGRLLRLFLRVVGGLKLKR